MGTGLAPRRRIHALGGLAGCVAAASALCAARLALDSSAQTRGSGWTAPAPASDAPAELREVRTQADALHAGRDQPGREQQAIALLQAAASRWPDSRDLNWRLARALVWAAEGATGDHRRALARSCWDHGSKAVAARADGAEGLYFTAICVGLCSESVGVLGALLQGLEGRFRDPLVAAMKVADRVCLGGVHNALGRYELPWPRRDLDESVRYLRRGLEVNPQSLRTRVCLAETLARRDGEGDEDEARRLLAEVVSAPTGAAERRAVALASAALARLGWR